MATYDPFAKFYDLEYGHKDNDIPFYLDIADMHGRSILEIGVGTGRMAIPLAQRGFSVHGLDNSESMLEITRQKIAKQEYENLLQLTCADMRNFKLDQKFSLCIIPFRAFLHNLNTEDQISTLKCIYDHLNKDGMLVFDLFVPLHAVLAQNRWSEIIEEDELSVEESGVTINCNVEHDPINQLLVMENLYIETDKTQTSQMKNTMTYRYVFRYEMELLLRLCGFETVRVFGGFEEQDYNFDSGIMIFVAKKC